MAGQFICTNLLMRTTRKTGKICKKKHLDEQDKAPESNESNKELRPEKKETERRDPAREAIHL